MLLAASRISLARLAYSSLSPIRISAASAKAGLGSPLADSSRRRCLCTFCKTRYQRGSIAIVHLLRRLANRGYVGGRVVGKEFDQTIGRVRPSTIAHAAGDGP